MPWRSFPAASPSTWTIPITEFDEAASHLQGGERSLRSHPGRDGRGDGRVRNFLNSHGKWEASLFTYSDNLRMLTLSRAGQVGRAESRRRGGGRDRGQRGDRGLQRQRRRRAPGAVVANPEGERRSCTTRRSGPSTSRSRNRADDGRARTTASPHPDSRADADALGGYAEFSYYFELLGGFNRANCDWQCSVVRKVKGEEMDVRAQSVMVFHLDKCIGCHTCTISCKHIWTDGQVLSTCGGTMWRLNPESAIRVSGKMRRCSRAAGRRRWENARFGPRERGRIKDKHVFQPNMPRWMIIMS